MKKKFLLFAGGLFLLSFTEGNASVGEKEPFSVRALEEPLSNKKGLISLTVITKKDIERCIFLGCDFTGILEQAGVQIQKSQRGFHTTESSDTDAVQVTLRGGSYTQTLLLVDGVQQKDSMISAPFWSFIPIHHIERIEIARGPQSSLYGADAMGGVIHIFTKKANCSSKEFCVDGGIQASNKDTTGHTAHMSANIRTDQTGIRLGIQGDRSSAGKIGDYNEKALTFHMDHTSEDGKLFVEGSSVIYKGLDGSEPEPAITEGDSDIASLGVTYYMSPDLLFKALAGYNKESQFYTAPDLKHTSRRISIKLLGEYHFEFANGNYIVTAGVEKKKEKVVSEPKDIYKYNERNTEALFTALNGNQGPLTYQVAVRADNLSGDTNEKIWTWNANTSWRIAQITTHEVSLRGGMGTGFRHPGFDEKFHFGGNPNLESEESKTYEIGLRIEKPQSYFLDIVAFRTHLENPVVIPLNKSLPEGADIEGVEIQGKFIVGQFSGWGQLNYTNTDNTENLRAHNPMTYAASFGVDYSATSDLTVGAVVTHRGEREDDWLSGESVNLLDFYMVRDLSDNVRLGVALKNATDEQYKRAFFTEGERRTLWFTLQVIDF